MKMHGTTMKIM